MDEIITDRKFLRQVSQPTTPNEVYDLKLIERIQEATKTAWTRGCGLAAIQIGVPLRFAWYRYAGKEGVLYNPIITARYGEHTDKEGCLSIPKRWTSVSRAYEIEYTTNGKRKSARGFLARLIQHEIDHMDGILVDEKEKR